MVLWPVGFFKASSENFPENASAFADLQTTTGQIQGNSVLERCIILTELLLLKNP